MVLSEDQIDVQVGGASYKDFDKMDDVMGQAWVEDPEEVWRLAAVRSVSSDGKTLFIVADDEETVYTVGKDRSHPFDPSHAIDMDDLAFLNNMHEAPLLHVLKRRFKSDHIYTICSDVLISINPYKKIPLLYDLDKATGTPLAEHGHRPKTAAGSDGKPTSPPAPSRPHVYSVAERAFRFMTEPKEALLLGKPVALKNQSIIISGESGAGKTEASKYVMRYLITVANALHHDEGRQEQQHGDFIERCLLRSNIVLEAFGNAKTLRNDNSSRFGKYIKLQYDSQRHLIGAWTDHFLLEKSRLVHVDWEERNYHIYYQMLRGLPKEQLEALHLTGDPEDYTILSQGGCCTLEDVDDAQDFAAVAEALATLDLSPEEVGSLWRLLAVLLHLGNLEYSWDEDENSHVQLISPQVELSVIAEMMGTTPLELSKGICSRSTSSARGSTLCIPLTLEQTRNNVQALIKYAYGEAFQWLVRKINSCHSNMTTGRAASSFIGILDIFGFEIMTRNSFEQLCINFANEVLQQQFNMHVFVLEQQEYVAEELDWSVISFRDNQPVIDLISKKPSGLLIMLEEQGMLARKVNNDALLTTYHNTHLGKVDCYAKPRFQSDEFIIRHFAGEVTYSVAGLIEKNNDSLHKDLLMLLHESDHVFFRNLVTPSPSPNTPGYIPPLPAQRQSSSSSQAASSHQPSAGSSGMAAANGSSSGMDLDSRLRASGVSDRRPAGKDRRGGARGGAGSNAGPGPSAICHGFTVSATFRRQLDELTTTLKMTEPHYIKCIKPNAIKAAGGFSPRLVVQQLRYSGVLEVVRIRREAYPTRIPFEEFYRRFDVLLGSAKPAAASLRSAKDYRAACQSIVVKVLPPGGFQLGKRKIFLRDNGLDVLRNAIRDFFAGHAARIQAQMRAFVYSRRYRLALRRIRLVQRRIRMHLLRKRFLRYRLQIVRIQTSWRRHRTLTRYQKLCRAALVAQTYTRRFLAVKSFSRKARANRQRMEDSATAIAAHYRGYRARCWRRTTLAAMAISSLWRGFVARRHYRRLRAAIAITARWRGVLARRRCRRLRSAIAITACWRGFVARRHYQRTRAAIAIVARWRGFSARRHYRRTLAAIRITARWRGVVARRQYVRLRSVALIVAQLRGLVCRKTYARQRRDVILVQSRWRARQARREFRVLRAAVRLQSAARAWAARKQFSTLRTQARLKREREERAAACCIQACWKGRCRRQAFLALCRAALVVQKHVRRYQAQCWKARTLSGLLTIQTAYRGHRCRVAYRRERSAIVLQARVRGFMQRRAYLRLLAAIRLQTWYRCRSARRHYLRVRAAIRLQAWYRCRTASFHYCRLRATIRIQAWRRGVLARKHCQRLRAAIRLQAWYRCVVARYHYRRLRATVRLQCWARCLAARQRLRCLRAVVTIQSAVRGWQARQRFRKVRGIIRLQAIVRGHGPRRWWRRARRAVRTLQRACRQFLTETLVASRVQKLHHAAETGQLNLVARMLDERPGLGKMRNARQGNRTLIHAAAQCDDVSMLSFLNPSAPDLLVRDAEGNTPFLLACARGNLDVIKKCAAICDSAPTEAAADGLGSSFVTPQKGQRAMSSGGSSGRRSAAAGFVMASATPDSRDVRVRSAAFNRQRQHEAHLSLQRFSSSPQTPLPTPRRGHSALMMATPCRGGQRPLVPASTTSSIYSHQTGRHGLPLGTPCTQDGGQGGSSNRIRSGWLKKRRETDRWQRRWVVLTDTHLKYYHRMEDRTPSKVIDITDHALVKLSERIDFCFEIYASALLDRRNREGRLYFQAEDEMELQAWYSSLRGVMANVPHIYGRRLTPIRYGNPDACEAMVQSATNHQDETALHAVARAVGRPRQVAQPIQVATWLIEHGAALDARDLQGNTPAHVALLKGPAGLPLAMLLVKRGLDPYTRNGDDRTLHDLVSKDPAARDLWRKAVLEREDLIGADEARATPMLSDSPPAGSLVNWSPGSTTSTRSTAAHHPTPRQKVVYAQRGPPYRQPGVSYVQVFMEKLTMTSERLSMPFLLITVYSPKGNVVEPPQRIGHPAIHRPGSIWWGTTWYMHTPVENLPPGAFVVIEFRDRRGYLKPGARKSGDALPEDVLIAWTVVHVDDGSVDTTSLNQEMYRPPVDLKLQRMEPAEQFLSGDLCVYQGNVTIPSHARSFSED